MRQRGERVAEHIRSCIRRRLITARMRRLDAHDDDSGIVVDGSLCVVQRAFDDRVGDALRAGVGRESR